MADNDTRNAALRLLMGDNTQPLQSPMKENTHSSTHTLYEEEQEKPVESKKDLTEELASLEHDQWVEWAKNILDSEDITAERAERWKDLFIPYAELSEEMKEKDREWARKVLKIVNGDQPKPTVESNTADLSKALEQVLTQRTNVHIEKIEENVDKARNHFQDDIREDIIAEAFR